MQNFIVLGIVPGTNFQLTFDFWLSLAIGLVCLPFVVYVWHRRTALHAAFIALRLAIFIDQYHLPA